VFRRSFRIILKSNAKYQKEFRERKRNELKQNEFDQFLIDNSFSSTTTDQEKYELFVKNCETIKIKEL